MSLSAPEALHEGHDLSRFSCGKPALDTWLRARALNNHRLGFTAVMVVHRDGVVVGYYGLAPTAVLSTAPPRTIRTGQPPSPIPCILLGQLAVDSAYAGRGIGSGLLRHALQRAVAAATLIAGRALVVRAIDDDAAGFWRRCGFVAARDDPYTLFRSLGDVAASLAAVGDR